MNSKISAKRKTRTTPWDAAEYLNTPREVALYLQAALDEGDSALVSAALGDIARSKGMRLVAHETGLGRESLYKSLSKNGNPELATVIAVLNAVGLKLRAVPV